MRRAKTKRQTTNRATELRAKILGHCEALRIVLSEEQLDSVLSAAEQGSWSYLELLEQFLGQPAESRRERSVERRIRAARFPAMKTLEGFDWQFNARAIDRVQIEELAKGDFIRRKNNLLVVGNSGIGKSHLLEGIGRRACVAGYSVRYVLSEELLADLGASLADRTTAQCVRNYARPDLLVLDGFGFDRIEREESPQALSLLYKVIDQRNTRRSTALITNVDFEAWNEYLDDAPMVMALLDRLSERAIILKILEAKSYRAHTAQHLPPPQAAQGAKCKPSRRAKG